MKPFFDQNNITIVSCCNDRYIPYLGVCLKSVLAHISDDYNYDIIILEFEISQENKQKIIHLSDELKNVSIRFCNVNEEIKMNTNEWKVGKWSKELYITLLIPYVLKDYTKVIYMDCDVINLSDMAELYQIELENNIVGAVRLLANVNIYYAHILSEAGIHCFAETKPDNIDKYFNNGVMLLNTEEFRKNFTLEYILHYISSQNFLLLDQDCVNFLCVDKVKYIDSSWNTYPYTEEEYCNSIKMCPDKLHAYYKDYMMPKNIHYTTTVKPWLLSYGSYYQGAAQFWKFAKETEFYADLLQDRIEYEYKIQNLQSIIYREFDEITENHKKVYLYGLGMRGREFIRKHPSIHIEGIIDSDLDKQKDTTIKVYGIDELNEMTDKNIVIIVSLDRYEPVVHMLWEKGFHNLYSYRCMEKRDKVAWKARSCDYKAVDAAYVLFQDDKSQCLYRTLLEKRRLIGMDRNLKCLDIYEGNTYFGSEPFHIGKNEIYVDVGSYNGCTVQAFKYYVSNQYDKVLAFEMNKNNYQVLKQSIIDQTNNDRDIYYNIALGNHNGVGKYQDEKYSSKLTQYGTNEIQVMKLDEVEEAQQATFIKINVGNTEDVILGGYHIIHKNRPKLAICISNSYDDLWKIPQLIKKINPEYKLTLKHHSSDLSLTVLYAYCE